jgi:hypothetical protein
LARQLEHRPTLLTDFLTTLLQMAAFQQVVWDRLDACAEALLPIIVCDQSGFEVSTVSIV